MEAIVGIDVEIAIRAKPGHTPHDPRQIDGAVKASAHLDGYTHEMSSCTRYYAPHYERGPWPDIAAYLLELLADPNVEAVAYGGDSSDYREPVTIEWLTQMNQHYIDNCERPYREGSPVIMRDVSVTVGEPK